MTELRGAQAPFRFFELRELIVLRPGGWLDRSSLERLRELCRAAVAEIDDAECRQRLRFVEALGTDLFSAGGAAKWNQKDLSGADFLRLEMLREVDACQSRLSRVRAAKSAFSEPFARAA